MNLGRRFAPVVVFLLLIVTVGTMGYTLLEGWTPVDAFYMTIITLTTVGFSEVQPLSSAGRIFTVVLIISGLTAIAYASRIIIEYLITTDVSHIWRHRRMKQQLNELSDHLIVCGYGRVGQNATETLTEGRRPFVIIDDDAEKVQTARNKDWLAIVGDATHDDLLREVGIEKAWGMLISTGSDVNNLFIVLSARALNPKLVIVARASEVGNEAKMLRAGADKVVSPYRIGGRHMANTLIRPHVTEFLDVVTLSSGLELWLEEIPLRQDSPLVDHSVIEANIRVRTGVTLVAIRRSSSGETISPDGNVKLAVGDELIALGTRDQLRELEQLSVSI